MAITYAAALLNEFGFPHLSELSICGAPEMHEPPTYLQILILNQTLVAAYPLPARKLISMFGRRVEAAITEYRKGRYLLIDYVNALPKPHHKLDTIL